jgi:hypothetical protein
MAALKNQIADLQSDIQGYIDTNTRQQSHYDLLLEEKTSQITEVRSRLKEAVQRMVEAGLVPPASWQEASTPPKVELLVRKDDDDIDGEGDEELGDGDKDDDL